MSASRLRLPALSLFFSLAILISASARGDFYLHHWDNVHTAEKKWDFDAKLNYYTTKSNFEADGTQTNVPNLNSYSRIGTDVTGSYGVAERLNFFGRLTWARIQVSHQLRGGTAYGLTDQTFGANYRIYEDNRGPRDLKLIVDLQSQIDFPLYSNSSAEANRSPFMGDGTYDWTTGAFATLPLWQGNAQSLHLIGGLGYTYRNAGFSSAVPWSITVRVIPKREGFLGSLSFAGIRSLETDQNRNTTQSFGSGGSYFTYAVNPTLITFRGDAGYQLAPQIAFYLSGSHAVYGQSAPSGFSLAFGAKLHLGADEELQKEEQQFRRANRGLVYYGMEAKVTKATDRLSLIKINKGSQDGVEVGLLFDIFNMKPDGSIGEAIARAKVTHIKVDEAALSILEYYKEVWIEEGFIAKRVLQ